MLKAKTKKATEKPTAANKTSAPKLTNDVAAVTSRTLPRVSPLTLALVLLGIIAGVGGYFYNRYWNVATVNGAPITRLEYYKAMEAQAGQQVLDDLITRTLIKQEAAKQGVSVDQAVVDNQIASWENQMQAQGTTLDQELAAQGMRRSQLIDEISTRELVQQLGKGDVQVTDDQIDAYIKANGDTLPTATSAAAQRDSVKTLLENQAANKNIQDWLDSLHSKATIVYN